MSRHFTDACMVAWWRGMQGRAPTVQTSVKFRDFQFWSNIFVRFGCVVSPLNLPSLLMVRRSFKLCQWIFTYWSLKVKKKIVKGSIAYKEILSGRLL